MRCVSRCAIGSTHGREQRFTKPCVTAAVPERERDLECGIVSLSTSAEAAVSRAGRATISCSAESAAPAAPPAWRRQHGVARRSLEASGSYRRMPLKRRARGRSPCLRESPAVPTSRPLGVWSTSRCCRAGSGVEIAAELSLTVRCAFGLGEATPDAVGARGRECEREAVDPDRTLRTHLACRRDGGVVYGVGVEHAGIEATTRGGVDPNHATSSSSPVSVARSEHGADARVACTVS